MFVYHKFTTKICREILTNNILNMEKLFSTKRSKILFCKMVLLVLFLATDEIAYAGGEGVGSKFSTFQVATQQNKKITGTVTDENGVPLPGVSVVVKNTTRGTSTNFDGKYEILVRQGEVLEYHFVGFATQEKRIGGGNQLIINIILKEQAEQLGDVVVVGFGTQKKESVVSSVSTVKGTDLRLPTRSLTNNLAGQVSGLIAIQRKGEPGYDESEFYIRGISSFASGAAISPLVLVDGVPRSMNDIEPDEIESFTLLKDAAATSVYGAEGANGVVLITSKRGKNQTTQISYRGEYGLLSPTRLPSFLDAPNYMRIYNEALQNSGNSPIFTEDIIAKHASGIDPDLYPNVNWMSLIKNTTSNVRHTLNFRGGGEKARFFISGAFYNESGLFRGNPKAEYNNNIGLNRYNLRSNVDFNVTPTTLLRVDLSGQYLETNYPAPGVGTNGLLQRISTAPPYLFPMVYSDGTNAAHPRNSNNRINPYNLLMESGYAKEWRSMLQSNVIIEQKLDVITKGLTAKGSVSYDSNATYLMNRAKTPPQFTASGRDDKGNLIFSKVVDEVKFGEPSESNRGNKKIYIEGSLNYKRLFSDKHDVTGMLLYYRKEAQTHDQALAFRKEAYIGRATYMYDRRYSIEGSFGFTGSEAFSKENRFGFFPAIGLSWIVSNEKFFEGISNTINDLKFRASYGKTGNDNTGGARFLYRGTYSNAGGYHIGIGGSGPLNNMSGLAEGRFEAPAIGWEIEDKRNIGIDISLFRNRITLTADYFDNERHSILLQRRTVPEHTGFRDRPWQNYGRVSNKGFDASLSIRHNFTDDFSVGARGNFTYARNKILEYDEVPQKYEWMNVTGRRINLPRIYIAEGLYQESDFDITTDPATGAKQYALKSGLPVSTISSGVLPGDIKYKDLNGDGQINDYDRTYDVSNPTVPEIIYGFGANMEYKNFYVNVFFQGAGNVSTILGSSNPQGFFPFKYGVDESSLRSEVTNRWTAENPSEDVLFPRLRNVAFNHNEQASTWWLRDASFIRLKNVEIGYRLPKEVLKILKMSSGRFYLIGNNLHVWDKVKMWDPEMGNDNAGMNYPLSKSYTFGVEFSF